jgi:hypothetical protein
VRNSAQSKTAGKSIFLVFFLGVLSLVLLRASVFTGFDEDSCTLLVKELDRFGKDSCVLLVKELEHFGKDSCALSEVRR